MVLSRAVLAFSTLQVIFSRECAVDVHGVCFVVSDQIASWESARSDCQQDGGHLAVLEKTSLRQAVDKLSSLNIKLWIGLHQLKEHTPPYWVDGRKLSEHNQGKHFPWKEEDIDTRTAKCVVALPDGETGQLQWEYEDCENVHRYLCAFSDMADEHAKEKIQEEQNAIEEEANKEKDSPFAIIEKTNKNIEDVLIGGDMLIDPGLKDIVGEGRKRRGVIWMESRLWPEGKVYYTLDPTKYFSISQKNLIYDAIDEIEAKTCIRFIYRTYEENYVTITKASGCWSYLGMVGSGSQYLSLSARCFGSVGVPVHELLHALGFFHEQSRPDRDDFVAINYDNIRSDMQHNFKMYEDIVTQGVYYDYSSVMHYPRYAFAIDYTVPTIRLLKEHSGDIGQRLGLSHLDAYEINRIYNCGYPVDGGWSPFSDWSVCPVTCGGGTQTRTRSCNYPPPSIDPPGGPCDGEDTQTRICMDIQCPTDTVYYWLGCYWDVGEGELLTTVEDTGNPHLIGNYWERTNPVEQCARAAQSSMHDVFALRFGGKCYTINTAAEGAVYQDGGVSDACFNGIGTTDSIDVYAVNVPGWSEWGDWQSCIAPESSVCLGDRRQGMQIRSRVCLGLTPTSCDGVNEEQRECHIECDSPDPWLCIGEDLFVFLLEPVSDWDSAREYCQSLDVDHESDLPILQDESIRTPVRQFLIHSDTLAYPEKHGYWVGCSDVDIEGRFVWVDGTPVDMATSGWENWEPNNRMNVCTTTGEDCCRLWERSGRGLPRYNLDDDCCTRKRHFICQIRGYCPSP